MARLENPEHKGRGYIGCQALYLASPEAQGTFSPQSWAGVLTTVSFADLELFLTVLPRNKIMS